MRTWAYNEPDWGEDGEDLSTVRTMTDAQVLDFYFEHWKAQMTRAGKQDFITEENCIEDWAVVHWAWEVKNEQEEGNGNTKASH